MNEQEIEELRLRLYLGQKLSPEEERRLIRALQDDPETRREILEDARLEGLLRAVGRGESDVEGFVRRFLSHFKAEQDATRFIRRIETRIREDSPRAGNADPCGGSGALRRPSTRRLARTPWNSGNRSYLFPAFLAAGILFGVLLVLLLSSGPSPSGPGKADRKEAARALEEDKARAEAERKFIEIERPRRILEERKTPLGEDLPSNAEKRKRDPAQPAEDRRRIEEELKAAVASAKGTGPKGRPEEPKPRLDEPKVPPSPPEEKRSEATAQTQPSIGQIERLEGEAKIVGKAGRTAAREGQDVLSGDGLETRGETARLVLKFRDGTSVELRGETDVREVTSANGKRLFIARGTVRSWIAKQPEGQPMIFATPHGEATVIGTTIRIIVDFGEKGSSRLDVIEGNVKLRNLAGKTVDVPSGHFAVAAAGAEIVAKPGPLLKGLVGLWTFDRGGAAAALDSSGQKHDGKLSKGAAWTAEGRNGGALQLDGAGAFVRVPRTARMETPAVTVACWIRMADMPRDGGMVLEKSWRSHSEPTHASWALQTRVAGSSVFAVFRTGQQGAVHDLEAPEAIPASGEWAHLAGTYDPAENILEKRLYVNGKQVATAALKTPIVYDPTSTGDLYFGHFGGPSASTFKGLIDEVRIYNRALPADEVAELAQAWRK